jgi:hypothetical protein
MNRDAIVDKIKKLLRMKRGGTPDEIATALRLAQELADKHGIDLNAINPDHESQPEKPIGHQDEVHGARVSWESRYAGMICDEFFKVRVFKAVTEDRRHYSMRFVGEEWDRQIAIYVYRFLCGHFRREWATRRGRCRNRHAFMWGMYIGLTSKLRERQPVPQEAGIIIAERGLIRRNQYIDERWQLKNSSAAPDGDASQAKWKGYLAGRETEIRSGVKAGAGGHAEILPAGATKLLA